MNAVYESTIHHQLKPNRVKIEYKDDNVYPLGTFAGTIYKVRYLANGSFVASDTSDQLIIDRPR
jgi:hypothetical protein